MVSVCKSQTPTAVSLHRLFLFFFLKHVEKRGSDTKPDDRRTACVGNF